MDRVFLDANVLFSAAYSAENGLLKLWELAKNNSNVTFVTSAYALAEAERNVISSEHGARLHTLIKSVEIVETMPPQLLPKEVAVHDKDKPILLAAISAKATHLLTGDFKHFGKYYGMTITGIIILPPAEYLRKYTK